MSELIVLVEELLNQHRWAWHSELHCRCGWFAQPTGGTARDAHDAHVASHVAGMLTDRMNR